MLDTSHATSVWLVPFSGPAMDAIELKPKDNGVVIGRHDDCDVRLPPEADKVSRFHARFNHDGTRWRVTDLKSRWGTFLNGVKLAPGGADVPLNEGDLIRITPWTFGVRYSPPTTMRGLESFNDTHQMQTMVRAIKQEDARPLADDILALLLESAAGIHAASDEPALAQVVLDVAQRGTGLTNASLLRPVDASGRIEVIASRFGRDARESQSAPITSGGLYSRSLLATASNGIVAELSSNSGANLAHSIVQMKINSAICVPLMLGQAVAAYLYLDSRGVNVTQLRPNASAFCLALGRMAGLALANLKRIDVERRQALIEAELSAGAEAQRWILPRRHGTFGPFNYIGESRPGQYVGGDFFDVIDLGQDCLAVALGDVSGKGIPASVLMTATQGFLHAALREHGQPGRAMTDLNRFINPRRPESKFVTLWVGVFDAIKHELRFVDAGHGWAILQSADGMFTDLAGGDGLPIGVMEDMRYNETTMPLAPGGKALIVSDGIIEQFGAPDGANAQQAQFELEGVREAMRSIPTGKDEVAHLFEQLIAHAQTASLSDDATAVRVRW